MQDIDSKETEILGQWILVDGKMQGDAICKRIEWLLENRLEKIAVNKNWEALYVDPSDKRYWMLTYPESYRHGGGPPALKFVAKSEAILWQLRQGAKS